MPTETISNLFGEESPVRGDSVFSFVTRFVASKVTFHSFSAYLSFFSISVRLLGMFFQPTSRIDDCFDHSLINILISLSSCAYARTDAPGLWNRPIFCAWRKLFYAFTLSLSPSTKISLCCCPCDHVGFDTGTVRGRGNIDVGVGVDNVDNDDSDDNESSFFASLPARRQKCVTK